MFYSKTSKLKLKSNKFLGFHVHKNNMAKLVGAVVVKIVVVVVVVVVALVLTVVVLLIGDVAAVVVGMTSG